MIVDVKAKLLVRPGIIPKVYNAWSVPFSIKEAIGGFLDGLEAAGIILGSSYFSNIEERWRILHLWGLQDNDKWYYGCWPLSPSKPL